MKILLAGATGFIGARLALRLRAAGHQLVCTARQPPAAAPPDLRWLQADFAAWCRPEQWQPHLHGIDAVVNTVGIFRETRRQRFETLHVRAPIALFDACAEAGVKRVVQLSALGADALAPTAYLCSKHAADSHLLALPLDAVVVQPSLVFGPDGASARWFLALASLPLLPLPAGGVQPVQPLHVDDLVQALQMLVEAPPRAAPAGGRVALAGPAPLTLATYLQALRAGLQMAPARQLSLPAPLVTLAARLGDTLPRSLLDSASWAMLRQGSVASPEPLTLLLGHTPRAVSEFVPPEQAPGQRVRAQLRWLLPLLRLSIAIVWMATAIVSLGVFPLAESFELLARAGVPAALQPAALYGAALLDLALGVLTLAPLSRRHRRRLWFAQATLIGFYMVVIAFKLPEFWSHPYAPMLKNLPLLAALVLLAVLDRADEEPRWMVAKAA